jgi:hypothetical protein
MLMACQQNMSFTCIEDSWYVKAEYKTLAECKAELVAGRRRHDGSIVCARVTDIADRYK